MKKLCSLPDICPGDRFVFITNPDDDWYDESICVTKDSETIVYRNIKYNTLTKLLFRNRIDGSPMNVFENKIVLLESRASTSCKECKGTGQYIGLNTIEPCKECQCPS